MNYGIKSKPKGGMFIFLLQISKANLFFFNFSKIISCSMKKLPFVLLLSGFAILSGCSKDKEDDLAKLEKGEIRITVNGVTKDLKSGIARQTTVQDMPVFSLAAYKDRGNPFLEQVAISFYNFEVDTLEYTFGITGQSNLSGTYVTAPEGTPMTYMTIGYSQYTGLLKITELTESYVKGNFHFKAYCDQNEQNIEITDGEFFLGIEH